MSTRVFETMRAVNGAIPLWEHHLTRLMRSGIKHLPQYEDVQKQLPSEPSRIRLSVSEEAWRVESEPLGDTWDGLSIGIWPKPFHNPAHTLKTEDRAPYAEAWSNRPNGCDDMLLLTEDQSIAETTRLNLFWMVGDVLHTPDDTCTPLSGVARNLVRLWSPWPIEFGRYPLDDLLHASFVFGTNAVRGVVWIRSVGERVWSAPTSHFRQFQREFERKAYG
jgi:branched-subunit amino acid aminotransferase/4-amino-4-deoxychorismate lyase